ncbi:RagB/SusD family nutrient uptake outer membrane protein [Myroides sp. LJL116]
MKKIYKMLCALSIVFTTASCDKFLDIQPQGQVIPKSVKEYREFFLTAYETYPQHKSLSSIRTDEVFLLTGEEESFFTIRDIYIYKDQAQDRLTSDFPYEAFYKAIFHSNSIILNGVNTMEEGVEKQQLLGEAYGMKAMVYFDLVNLYAKPYTTQAQASLDRGIVIEDEVQIEKKKAPSSVEKVYEEIHKNIDKALEHLQIDAHQTGKNYRFSKMSVLALQARVYLYQKRYDKALESANKVLEYRSELQDLNSDLTSLADFTSVESIQALELTLNGGLRASILVSPDLIQSFDQENDLRFAMSFVKRWDNNYIVDKVGTAQNKVSFRTSEMYMIKAEALLELEQLDQAKQTLEQLLVNRYTPQGFAKEQAKISSMNAVSFKKYLLDERFREFAFEGHRWFDLRRANQKQIEHKLGSESYFLFENDIRYTLDFPKKAKQNNPYL